MTNIMQGCFGECQCSCGESDNEFDETAAQEMRLPVRLHTLSRQNIGWYCDRTVTDHHLDTWNLGGRSGLYLLWHKNDYCVAHQLFHMKALYAGKGRIDARFRDHWSKKATQEELLIYFTFMELENRVAKYVEQLILDIYDLPFNRSENRGRKTLCAHFSQGEVD